MANLIDKNKYNSENGFVMLATLLIIFILLVLSASIMRIVNQGVMGSSLDLTRLKAFYIAEAGIGRAKFELGTSDLDNVLKGPDNTPGTSDDGTFAFGSSVSFANGTYEIIVTDNDDGDSNLYSDNDNMVLVLSRGSLRDHTKAISSLMLVNAGNNLKAITVNGNLIISGSPHITGDNGSIHTNGDLKITSNPIIEQNATASGSYVVTGSPIIGGVSGGGYGNVDVPVVNPANYRGMMDYELQSNGSVYDKNGNFVASGTFQGWTWSSGFPTNKWTFSDLGGYQNSTYFIEGMAVVSGNPGTSIDPWKTTIVATEHIEVSGNPIMETKDLGALLVAGKDLKINGNMYQSFKGSIMAHGQLAVSGAPTLDGGIVIEDAWVTGLVSESEISGDINIQCNAGNYGIGPGKATIKNWHETME